MWKLPRLTSEATGEPLLQFDYPFTHHRVTLRIFEGAKTRVRETADAQRWVPTAELAIIAIAAPHRRAIERIQELSNLR